MIETVEQYKELFKKFDKEDYFEINQPFIENMISTQKQIRNLATKELIRTHPTIIGLEKPTESGKLYIKLLDVFKNQTLALNKILGNAISVSEEDDMFKKIKDGFNG